MEQKNIALQLLQNLENMVDPSAPVEDQLAQMRAQMAALAELPNIINQKLESVNKQISHICEFSHKIMTESSKREMIQEQQPIEFPKIVHKPHQYYQKQFEEKLSKFQESASTKQSVEITEKKSENLKQAVEITEKKSENLKQAVEITEKKSENLMQSAEITEKENADIKESAEINEKESAILKEPAEITETERASPKQSVEITEMEPDEEATQNIEIRVTKPSLTEEEDAIKREELRRSLEDLRMRKSVSPAKENTNTPIYQTPQNITPAPVPMQSQWSQTTQKDLRAARGKPEPAFGPGPIERPLYLPGGKRWKMSEYNEDEITETLVGQAEVIRGRALGVNFKKFEKPPVGVDHLKNSEVFRMIHDIDDQPVKSLQLFRPAAVAESDIRERLRSLSPANPAEDR